MQRPSTHRSKTGFHASTLYSQHFPDQSFSRMPGYSGHVPGVRVEAMGVGNTIGRTTHSSMAMGKTTQSMTGTGSSRDRYYDRPNMDAALRKPQEKSTWGHSPQSDRFRVDRRPGSKVGESQAIYKSDMVPGYGGFVPKTRGINGATTAVTAKLGLAVHDRDQEQHQADLLESRYMRDSKPPFRELPASMKPEGSSQRYVSQTMLMPPNTTTYDRRLGVMKGCTKFMPQKPWNQVSQNNAVWSRQTASLVGQMGSPVRSQANTPAFKPKPKRHQWIVDSATVYQGTPGL